MQYKEITEEEYNEMADKNGRYMVVNSAGCKHWYYNNKLHRGNGPAIERRSGMQLWYEEITEEEYIALPTKKGAYKIICSNGNVIWMKDDKRHRLNGYAFSRKDGYRAWHVNGDRHRTDGPAITYKDVDKYWYLNGFHYTKEEWFKQLTKEQLAVALANPENF